ncbi:MFS transporter [Deinococcus cavernae]|uniref:MFS transporter n=1 Tax=Deinococcus cavernae TaxID=2320857 RepID=A0A418VEI8_9DEIO|nr:MFS transporter [Deinococcus cavernae]RJF74505.1 MFS transporter [Deinococcus cavernae]
MALMSGQRSLVWALALLNTVAYGVLYYAQPLLAVQFEQAHGWTRSQTSLAFTLALLVTAFTAPRLGRTLDERGGRSLLALGAALGAISFALLALSSTLWLFTSAWLLAGVAMGLTFYEATFTVLGQHIQGANRTGATLTITLIAGRASTIFVPLITALLQGTGLLPTLLIISSLLLLCSVVVWRVVPLGNGQSHARQRVPFTQDAFFRLVTTAFTLTRVVMLGLGLQLVPMLLHDGYLPAHAAWIAGLMGAAALPGRMLFVPALGRLGVLRLTTLLVLMLLMATGLMILPHDTWLVLLATPLFGIANGALTLARAELLVAHYHPQVFGSVNGQISWWVNLAQAMTPFGMGWLFARSASYQPSLWMLVGLTLTAVITMAHLQRLDQVTPQITPASTP